eukprot:CAMPEP_0185294932 /NCGR_PEP_ID=MMETSP1363-20130426/7980_1 /TAXON_ID=38817 /ORGANISM="Gephyrocapsa oceanica, Strain RCC1303" /LENGTH=177 /DNA_ID=CAMNT_0027891433 /DNA_START=186 /DNA_END=716 /DNA_ORIENTATION=+
MVDRALDQAAHRVVGRPGLPAAGARKGIRVKLARLCASTNEAAENGVLASSASSSEPASASGSSSSDSMSSVPSSSSPSPWSSTRLAAAAATFASRSGRDRNSCASYFAAMAMSSAVTVSRPHEEAKRAAVSATSSSVDLEDDLRLGRKVLSRSVDVAAVAAALAGAHVHPHASLAL